MSKYKRRRGDRKDGRLLRSIGPFTKFKAFIQPTRGDGENLYEESFEVSLADKRLRQMRLNGYKGMGLIQFLIAAYVRCVSMMPELNRFVVGNRIYARDTIDVVLRIKLKSSFELEELPVKIQFEPTDTIFDVYRKINEKIDELKAESDDTTTQDVTETLTHLPRIIVRLFIAVMRFLDYFGWLSDKMMAQSPYHASVALSDQGALGANPVYEHVCNFGTLPLSVSFGGKRRVKEINKNGQIVDKKYLDMKFSVDDRISDPSRYAQFLKAARYIFKHPEILEVPPTKVAEDTF